MAETRELPSLVWKWCLPIPLLVHLVAKQWDRDGTFFRRWIESESGFIENATVFALIPAAILALQLGWRLFRQSKKAAAVWYLVVAAVCFSFAGEEVSWGQHWAGWESPEYFVDHNRQGETNIHNLNIHLGRVVKTILTMAIVIGGLILPLTREVPASASPRTTGSLIMASRVCVPAAAFVLGVRLVERCKTWFDLDWALLAVNLKESQELYIALFLLIYAWSAYLRNTGAARQRVA